MRRAHASKPRKLSDVGSLIIKSGELVDAQFEGGASLSGYARKVLLRLLQIAAGDAWEDREFSLEKRDLRTPTHKGDERVAPALAELMNIRVRARVLSPRGRPSERYAPLLAETTREDGDDDDGRIYWKFSETARRVMQASDHYAEIQAASVFTLQSRYAVTLYELGCLLHRRDNPVWRGTIEELRALLGVRKGVYRDWTDLRRFTLEPAQKEITQVAAPFGLQWVEHRQGRAVKVVELHFLPRGEKLLAVTRQERTYSKAGGRARREGTVETKLALTPELQRDLQRLQEDGPRQAAAGLSPALRGLLVQPGIPGLDDAEV